jgi:hypothetical protein
MGVSFSCVTTTGFSGLGVLEGKSTGKTATPMQKHKNDAVSSWISLADITPI